VLVFTILMKTTLPPAAFAVTGAAAVACYTGFVVASAIVLKLCRFRMRTYLPSLAFANTGNLGLPLALYAFGEQGLGYAIIFFSIGSISNFTFGQAIAAGQANWKLVAKSPIVAAVILGISASYVHFTPPIWLGNTLSLVAGMAIPLMLLTLGGSLARIKVASLPRAFALSFVRIGMGASIGAVVALCFGLTGTARSVLILQSGMPVAVFNYLFAQMWNNEPEEVASLVAVSTFVSIGTIPVLLALLMP